MVRSPRSQDLAGAGRSAALEKWIRSGDPEAVRYRDKHSAQTPPDVYVARAGGRFFGLAENSIAPKRGSSSLVGHSIFSGVRSRVEASRPAVWRDGSFRS